MVCGISVFEGLLGGVKATVFQMVFVLGPLFLFAVILHLLERTISRRLTRKLGWWSMLWTGWIGTPIHELSHAVFCIIFRHPIKEIALFKPDKKTGCLGYVHHTYNRRNPYHVIGNFFIGAAPLFGGAAALFLVLLLFYGDAAKAILSDASLREGIRTGNLLDMTASYFSFSLGVFRTLWQAVDPASWRFYLFLYLVVCIGSHLAPSPQDMEGMGRGFGVFAALVLAVNIVAAFFGGVSSRAVLWFAQGTGPVVALFAVAAVLNTLVAGGVIAVTSATDLFTVRGRGKSPDERRSHGA
jgi:uncharacterized membrane protein